MEGGGGRSRVLRSGRRRMSRLGLGPAPERATLRRFAFGGPAGRRHSRVVRHACRTPRTERPDRGIRPGRMAGFFCLRPGRHARRDRGPGHRTSDPTEPALLRGAAPSPRANRSTTPNARAATAPPGKRVPTIGSWVVSRVTDFRSAKPEVYARRSEITGRTPRPFSTT